MTEIKMIKGEVRFASGRKFVESMRHQGLTDEEAIKELCDNSFDADAKNIWIYVWEEGDSINISQQDDGNGMSQELLGKAVAFGETNNEDNSSKIGRFGFGMPIAIISKTKLAEVYSKESKKTYFFTSVDLNELEKDPTMRLYLPIEKLPDKKEYINLKTVESGTLIILKNCDRLEHKKVETIKKHLLDDLGITYRNFIAEGKKIYINNEPVPLDDPLMLIPKHRYYDELIKGLKKEDITQQTGYSTSYEIDPIPVLYINKEGKNATGYIRVKLVLLPIRDIWRTAESDKKKREKYGISQINQGFYILRNNRQLKGGVMSIAYQERHPSLNYFRGEVDFDSVLDDEFGIQTNKTRFNPSNSIKEKIRLAVRAVTITIKRESKKITDELSAKLEKENKIAEEIAKEAPYKTIKKLKEVKEEDIKKAIDKEVKHIEKDKDLSEEIKKSKEESVKEVLEKQMPFILDTEHNRQGPIFSWEIIGKTTKVILNREHPFYRYYWGATENSTYMRTMLKILIFTLVKGEQIQQEELEDGNVITYEILHNHWNMILRKFLTSDRFTSFALEELPKIEGYDEVIIE